MESNDTGYFASGGAGGGPDDDGDEAAALEPPPSELDVVVVSDAACGTMHPFLLLLSVFHVSSKIRNVDVSWIDVGLRHEVAVLIPLSLRAQRETAPAEG